MTFLIFLASLAILEYVLRPKPGERTERNLDGREPRIEDDLHALGTALDGFGRGQKPEYDAEPSKTRPASP